MQIQVSDALLQRIVKAVANAEGFGRPGDLPTRCHNPGDLTDDGDVGFGTARSTGIGAADITIYATDDDGWEALRRKFRRIFAGQSHVYNASMSIERIGMLYSKDPDWGINVARDLGVSADMSLAQLAATPVGPSEQANA